MPPLAGVPIAIKDVLSTRGVRTTCGSKILENYVPPYDATAVARLEAAGAVMLGKTNCDEFAMGSSNENSAYGPVLNPEATDRIPGGSSGGSAAAVAAGLAVASLGTDTGGSIRQPGAMCGVPAMMGSYGRVSRYGLIAFASSLDRIGPFANNGRDVATMLQVIAGRDPNDSTSTTAPVPDYRGGIGEAGRRVCASAFRSSISARAWTPSVRKKIEAGHRHFEEAGLQADRHRDAAHGLRDRGRTTSLRRRRRARTWRGMTACGTGCACSDDSLMAMYRKTRGAGFGAEVKRRIVLGTYVLSAGYYDAYYLKGQKVRALIAQDFRDAFTKGGRDCDADFAGAGVQAGRADERSAADVSG